MTYPQDYFETPGRLATKQGAVAEKSTVWGTYTVFIRGGKVWIEARGHGGAHRSMPQVSTVDEAKEAIWQYTKPPDEKAKPVSF